MDAVFGRYREPHRAVGEVHFRVRRGRNGRARGDADRRDQRGQMLGFRRVGHIEQNVRTVDYRLADYDLVIEGHGRHQGLGALVVRGHLVAAESDVHPVYGQRLGYVDRQRQLPCDDRSVDSHLGAPDFGTQRDGYGFGLERDRRVLGVARRFQVDILDHDIADRNLLARQSERKIAEFQLGQILTGAGQVDFLKRSPVVAQQRNFDAHVAFVHPDDLLAQVGRAAAVPAFVLAGREHAQRGDA